MALDIFVGAMIVCAAVAGVWCWWVDNGGSLEAKKNRKKEK